MPQPFEIIGQFPDSWRQDCADFMAAAAGHRWGGRGLERLVVVDLVPGGFIEAAERFMDRAEFNRWVETLGPAPRVAAKSFRAADGQITSVMIPLPTREMFLTFFTNQCLEGAALRRDVAEDYVWPSDAHLANSHILWRYYVAERARRELLNGLGWDLGDFDATELVSEAKDVEKTLVAAARESTAGEFPGPVEQQVWLTMLRLWAAARGSADGGAVSFALELRRFAEQPFLALTSESWERAADGLRELWAAGPHQTSATDEFAREHIWLPFVGALEQVWLELRAARNA